MANNYSKKNPLLAGILGAVIFFGAGYLAAGSSDQSQTIASLEDKIKILETSLAKNEENLKTLRMLALHQNGKSNLAAANTVNKICKQARTNNHEHHQSNDNSQTFVSEAPGSIQTLKDLATNSVNDPRSFAEKANDLLANNPTKEKVAIVSKSIFDMANNRESLSDHMLQSMYTNQTDPDLKRVIAQVLSNRGNNILMESHITETQSRLKSANPNERQSALTNLAKTHSSNAVSAIAPLLKDPNIDVKLDALLALRATGNQSHLSLVENLLDDPDPSVSTLAKEVAGDLRNLSDSARTMLSIADIAAELPMMQNP
ncbi:MAG: HEAT repeat domain-containing protein [Pseudomonadota bacterium]